MTRRSKPTAVADPPKCVQCRDRIDTDSASRWWCSEDCFYQWQRTNYAWTE